MSYVAVNGTRLWVEDTGEPPAPRGNAPVVFSHGLLWSTRMFDPQVGALRDRYRCVAYDHRGQGRSDPAPGRGPVTIEQCYADAVALLERLALGPVHFVGLSMGGFVAMRLAARRPDLVRSLALLETSADAEPEENRPRYRLLANVVRWLGPRVVASRVMPIMFGRTFLTDPARAAERGAWRRHLLGNRRGVGERMSARDTSPTARVPRARVRRRAPAVAAWRSRRRSRCTRLTPAAARPGAPPPPHPAGAPPRPPPRARWRR